MQLVRLSAGLTFVLETWRLCVFLRLSLDAIAQQVAVIRIEYFRLRFGTGILPIVVGIAWTLCLRVVRHLPFPVYICAAIRLGQNDNCDLCPQKRTH